MDTTRNIIQKRLGNFEYAKLLSRAEQVNILGSPITELSKDELIAALIFTMQSNQEQAAGRIKKNSAEPSPIKAQPAGLW